MPGLWTRRVMHYLVHPLKRHLMRSLRTLSGQRRGAWRDRPAQWTTTNVRNVLKSAKGEAHLDDVATELAQRLTPILARLDEGDAVLDDRHFAAALQHALSWLACQGDITRNDATLRAYCDVTASMAILDRLVGAIAEELWPANVGNELHVTIRLANAAGSWREPLILAGRRMLDAGRYDEAAEHARRALNIMSSCPESQRLLLDAIGERQRRGGTIDPLARAGLADLRGRFCPRPFEVLVSGQTVGWSSKTNTTGKVMGASY